MTTKVLSFLALLLAALIAFALLRDDSAGPVTDEPAAVTETPLPVAETPETGLDAPEAAAAQRARIEPAVEEVDAEAPPVAGADEELEPIVGSIVLLAEDGQRIEDASGTVGIGIWSERRGRNREVEVVNGQFRILDPKVPAVEARLELRSGVLDGRSIVAAEPAEGVPERSVSEEDGRFLLECVHRGAIELEVRDARTEALVDSVDVAMGDWMKTYPGFRPALLVEGAASPVQVDLLQLEGNSSFRRGGTWMVGGPGYAWESVKIDTRGDRQVVRLERAGTVVVEVRGLGVAKGLQLFVSTPEHKMRYERPLREDGTYRLDRWPLGPVEAFVQRGDWFSEPKVFGTASGEVAEGDELTLGIDVDPEAATPTAEAELELEVLVPAGWAIERLSLSLTLEVSATGAEAREYERAEPDPEPWGEDGQRFLFDFGTQPLGTWIAATNPGLWRQVVELEQSGRQQLILPAPADVTLTVLDPDTGAAVEDATVNWYCTLDGPASGWSLESATELPEPGRFELRAPATEVVIQAEHEGYGHSSGTFQLTPGEQSLELELAPLVGFELKLMEGDTHVPLQSWGWMPDLHAPGSDEKMFGARRSMREGNLLYWLDEPALVEVRFPELEGFAPIEPLEIDLRPGEMQPVEVQVVSLP